MTITASSFKTYFQTDLADAVLTAYIDDATDFCVERAGPQGEQTVVLQSEGRYLVLPKAIAAAADVSEIIERQADTTNTLTTADWRWNGGRILERLTSGNPDFWGTTFGFACDVVVTYTPKDDANRRDRVVVDLVKLAIQYSGLASERAGDYAMTAQVYAQERDRIVRQLNTRMAFA